MIRIAHVSDPHVLSRTAAGWRSIVFNKRLTGYANLVLRRGHVHRREYLLSVFAAAAEQSDHVVVTGDPGNHDIYLPATHEGRRFPHHFGRFLDSELPEFARDLVIFGALQLGRLRHTVPVAGPPLA